MEDLLRITCPECSTVFGITKTLFDARVDDHEPCYCPQGHVMNWPAQEDPDLRQLLGRIEAWEGRLIHLEDQMKAQAKEIGNALGTKSRGSHAATRQGTRTTVRKTHPVVPDTAAPDTVPGELLHPEEISEPGNEQ